MAEIEINATLCISGTEKIHGTVPGMNDDTKSWLVRPEPNSVGWTEHHFSKFSKHGGLVVILLSRTIATAKACLKLSRHLRSVVNAVNSN